jgi:hypothetical protein
VALLTVPAGCSRAFVGWFGKYEVGPDEHHVRIVRVGKL